MHRLGGNGAKSGAPAPFPRRRVAGIEGLRRASASDTSRGYCWSAMAAKTEQFANGQVLRLTGSEEPKRAGRLGNCATNEPSRRPGLPWGNETSTIFQFSP